MKIQGALGNAASSSTFPGKREKILTPLTNSAKF